MKTLTRLQLLVASLVAAVAASPALATCNLYDVNTMVRTETRDYALFVVENPEIGGGTWKLGVSPRHGACLAAAGHLQQSPVRTYQVANGPRIPAPIDTGQNCDPAVQSGITVDIPAPALVWKQYTNKNYFDAEGDRTSDNYVFVGFRVSTMANATTVDYDGAIMLMPGKHGTDKNSVRVYGICTR